MESWNLEISDKIIIAGDWNSIQDVEMDKKGGREMSKSTVTESMSKLLNNWNVLDIWRKLNPLSKRFTYRQKRPLIQSRLDYFFITEEMEDLVYSVDIIPSIWSDHSCITLHIKHLEESEKGNGFWKMNNSLLKEPKYCDELKLKLNK